MLVEVLWSMVHVSLLLKRSTGMTRDIRAIFSISYVCCCRGVGMKFELGGLTLQFSCIILLNIKDNQTINLSVVKGNKLLSYF